MEARPRSPVDAFFEATEPLDVLRALKALSALSCGEVSSTATTRGKDARPEIGGVFCPHLFGAADDGEQRWAHIDLPLPVLHPACVAAIGQLTELTRDEILSVLQGAGGVENGPQDLVGLETLLEQVPGHITSVLRDAGFEPTELLIRRVPVTPLADRPLAKMPGGHVMIDEVSRAYVEIVGRAARQQQLLDFGAPERILRAESRALQHAFDRVLAREPAGATWERFDHDGGDLRATEPPVDDLAWIEGVDLTRPIAAAFVDGSSVLVQFPRTTMLLDHAGAVLDAFATPGCRLIGVDEEGRHALFYGDGFHVRDLRARHFLDHVPSSFPAGLMGNELESAYLVDARRGRRTRLRHVVDHPVFTALSPDGRHLWVEDKQGNGGVYGVETGLHEANAEALRHMPSWSLLGVDGTIADAAQTNDSPEFPSVRAIVLTPRDRFLVADGRVVVEDDKVTLVLAAPAPVVAFSRSGEQLLAVRRDHAAILSLDSSDPPRIMTRIPLEPLRAVLEKPRKG